MNELFFILSKSSVVNIHAKIFFHYKLLLLVALTKHCLKLTSSLFLALRKKCPYLELFCLVFSRIRTEYGEIRSISPYSIRMREKTDQSNSEYAHFLRSVGESENLINIFFNQICVKHILDIEAGYRHKYKQINIQTLKLKTPHFRAPKL